MEIQLNSILKEIETQQQKPLEEQLNDFKIAGAKLILAIDNLMKEYQITDLKGEGK